MIASAKKAITICGLIVNNPGIMAGRNLIAFEALGHAIKRCKLQAGIARNTRYRCLAAQIALDEWFNDRLFELTLKIQNVEGKSESISNAASVINIVQRTAAARQRLAVLVNRDIAVLVPQLHGEANELMALLL